MYHLTCFWTKIQNHYLHHADPNGMLHTLSYLLLCPQHYTYDYRKIKDMSCSI